MIEANLKCPNCGSRRVVVGEFAQGLTIGAPAQTRFRAFAARLPSMRSGAAVEAGAFACAQCGTVWSRMKPEDLLQHLERIGSSEVLDWIRQGADVPL
jgi:predicted RNA-binding Zn-ribbon protein involved in translation (DUF1610 family)